ncbi:CueP family metal-binding protein [Pseudactinotalea sp. HY158]|uniref:CueP family metal-binding protein n=1 Tax=Pseudactinotalea sp. HY158 TaxID=2654547 RepID=UPI001892310D|nr:CueP family metal-binding protein [Pseudactinotalea sp. HY158]
MTTRPHPGAPGRRSPLAAALATVLTVAVLTVLSACTPTDDRPEPARGGEQASSTGSATAEGILAEYDLAGLDGRELVDRLEATPITERPTGLIASVRSDAVLVTGADGREAAVPLPADEFYVSIAPFVDQTHECYFHSLTTCLGELSGEEFDVQVLADDGSVVLAETASTNDNGFLGLWLPRDLAGTLTVTQGERTATVPLATGADDPTCLTTVHLT